MYCGNSLLHPCTEKRKGLQIDGKEKAVSVKLKINR